MSPLLKLVVATVACFLAVPILGALLGAIQLAFYRRRVRAGKMKDEEIPFFGALLLRGMIMIFAVVALAAIFATAMQGPPA